MLVGLSWAIEQRVGTESEGRYRSDCEVDPRVIDCPCEPEP
jgi:hypothetical protein